MWGKPTGGNKRRAKNYHTLRSVEELKDFKFHFDNYDYRINSEKWIVPKPANPPKELTNSTQPPPSSDNEPSIPTLTKDISSVATSLVQASLPRTPRREMQTSPRNVIEKIGSGANKPTKCGLCKLMPTGHYCVNEKKGSNTFFSDKPDKEVCGFPTCTQCRSRSGDDDGKYMNYCITCSSKMKEAGPASHQVSARKKRKVPPNKKLPLRQSVRGRMQSRTRQRSQKK